MKPTLFLLGLVLCPFTAYAETFSNNAFNFKIDYPQDRWELIEHDHKPVENTIPILTLVSKVDTLLPTNIHILTQEAKNVTLGDYFKTNTNKITDFFGPFKLAIEDKGTSTINGNEAYFIQYSWVQPSDNDTSSRTMAKQYFLEKSDIFYVITYTQPKDSAKVSPAEFDEVISTLQFLDQKIIPDKFSKSSSIKSDNPQKGGCLIATATYGSELAPQVQKLRELRDNILAKTSSGSAFMTVFNSIYYSFSPAISDWERANPIFREAVKITITPLLGTLSILNYLDIDSEGKMIGYGTGIILLNIVIYVAAPAFVMIKLKDRRQVKK